MCLACAALHLGPPRPGKPSCKPVLGWLHIMSDSRARRIPLDTYCSSKGKGHSFNSMMPTKFALLHFFLLRGYFALRAKYAMRQTAMRSAHTRFDEIFAISKAKTHIKIPGPIELWLHNQDFNHEWFHLF